MSAAQRFRVTVVVVDLVPPDSLLITHAATMGEP
jgi:hypothetical protein